MASKILLIIKTVLLVLFSLLWFLFVQAEYEMVTKPILQNEFPIIKGISAAYFLGVILLVISALILFLLYSTIKTISIINMIKISKGAK